MRPNQSLAAVTARILEGMTPVLEEAHPDVVMVQGDTTTAFAATLAAFYARVPVAHVEAGLRTYDLNAPFPEEAMRQMVSRLATWHFAPTEQNREALIAEKVDSAKIFVTGNTVIDALLMMRQLVVRGARRDLLELPEELVALLEDPARRRMVLITGHRRESFGEGIQDICTAIATLAAEFREITFIYPVHLNPNVLEPVHRALSGIGNIHLLRPVNYYTFVFLMHRAELIISDSGGVQEEAPSLKVPVLVTRAVTERMEVVESGNVKLVGSDYGRIVAEVRVLLTDEVERLRMTKAENPYGDGCAADRILETISAGGRVVG
jgi:UDP-N-acetylglucosamine 2-epimerase (non-hydrolysing)